MCNMADRKEVTAFVQNMKSLVSEGAYDFVPRKKNLSALAKSGMTIRDVKEALLGLTTDDYYKGPKKDFTRPGEVWEFKKKIDEIQFYIKVKIVNAGDKKILKCLGFHEDEFSENGMR